LIAKDSFVPDLNQLRIRRGAEAANVLASAAGSWFFKSLKKYL
jgi:hypothetical protein